MIGKFSLRWSPVLGTLLLSTAGVFAGEADIKIPDLTQVKFDQLGGVSGSALMYMGILLCFVGAAFGLIQYRETKALAVHDSMSKVSQTIWETCKTYLFTQGRFLAILWLLIAACMIYYFGFLTEHAEASGQTLATSHVAFNVLVILLASVLGILGSYSVAWFGIRISSKRQRAHQGSQKATNAMPSRIAGSNALAPNSRIAGLLTLAFMDSVTTSFCAPCVPDLCGHPAED